MLGNRRIEKVCVATPWQMVAPRIKVDEEGYS